MSELTLYRGSNDKEAFIAATKTRPSGTEKSPFEHWPNRQFRRLDLPGPAPLHQIMGLHDANGLHQIIKEETWPQKDWSLSAEMLLG